VIETIILWNHVGTSDKVWGVTDYHGRAVSFWGPRAHSLRFKLHAVGEDVEKLIRKKKSDRDYRESSFADMEIMKPGFQQDFDTMLTMCICGDGFHNQARL
jgi:hypothetical protein